MVKKIYPIALERLVEIISFIVVMIIIGPIFYKLIDDLYLYRLSNIKMVLETSILAVASPLYLVLSVALIIIMPSRTDSLGRFVFVIPALVVFFTSNTLTNWVDSLVLLTTSVLLSVSAIVAWMWKVPKQDGS
jgi:hypothetical protein